MIDLKKIEAAVNLISAEKKIPKEKLVDIIESAIKTAYKKDYGNRDENVSVKLDIENGNIEITIEKTLVKEVVNPSLEISFEELGDDAEGFKEGDTIEIDVTDEVMSKDLESSFGRIASQAARQVIIQKIGDSEKEKTYELFRGREGEVISMKVELIENGKVILNYNGNQVILPKGEQVSKDRYVADQRLYVYVASVTNDEKTGPKVVLSRKNAGLVKGLFGIYVPELNDGTITIDEIARIPGIKTKILVSSNASEIDAAGTMIGQKGIRVKSVMDEISGERIDIISNTENKEEVIKKALAPAEILKVDVSEEDNVANVYLLPSERAKAVGKSGVNVNLASQLTGFKISIIEITE
ncbi:MAG: transcription termination factor NusA [Candidatus Gracilibacteria bacterium]|nr:transcription termination factor NusA [Candidatus Gracilibacteria bacterium]